MNTTTERSGINDTIMWGLILCTLIGVYIFNTWLLSGIVEDLVGDIFYPEVAIQERKYLAAGGFAVSFVAMFSLLLEVCIFRMAMGKLKINVSWE